MVSKFANVFDDMIKSYMISNKMFEDDELLNALRVSRAAIIHTCSVVSKGSANQTCSLPGTDNDVKTLRTEIKKNIPKDYNFVIDYEAIRERNKKIIKYITAYKCGNCSEKSIVAEYFAQQYFPNSWKVGYNWYDHCFVIVNQDFEIDIHQMSKMKHSTFICDPWKVIYYPASEYEYIYKKLFPQADHWLNYSYYRMSHTRYNHVMNYINENIISFIDKTRTTLRNYCINNLTNSDTEKQPILEFIVKTLDNKNKKSVNLSSNDDSITKSQYDEYRFHLTKEFIIKKIRLIFTPLSIIFNLFMFSMSYKIFHSFSIGVSGCTQLFIFLAIHILLFRQENKVRTDRSEMWLKNFRKTDEEPNEPCSLD